MPELPPSLWRMAVVIGVLLVVLWFLFVGIRALYRATMLPPPAETTTSETVQKEVIDAILAENGRDIEAAKKPFADYV